MISIQLPDGSQREYPGPVTVAEVAASIGPGLAKAAIAGRIGEGQGAKLVDTSYRIDARHASSRSSPTRTPMGSRWCGTRRRTCSPTR